jgi:uncharacterized protein YggE
MSRLILVCATISGTILGAAARAEDDMKPSITVAGHGEVRVTPDQVTVMVGVTTEAKTAAEALQANSAKMKELMKSLKDHDVADKHIQTSNFNVSPQQIFDRDGKPPKLVGYTVTNQVSVTVLEVARLGSILDAVVQAGSNQIQGVNFSIADPQPHMEQARRKAIADARKRAEIYAEAAGVKLGGPVLISETSASPPRPMYAMGARMAVASSDVPIAAGEHSIDAHVNVTYEISR